MLDYSAIGQNLAELRKKAGKTQVELAALLKVTHQAVSKWERGQTLPGIESFLTLSEMYRLTVNELVSPNFHQGEPPAASLDPELSDSEEMSNIWPMLLQQFRKSISQPSFDTWFKETTAEFNGDSFTVYSPTTFANEWLSVRYAASIAATIRSLTGRSDLKIHFRACGTDTSA